MSAINKSLQEIIAAYNSCLKKLEAKAIASTRAYSGFVRAEKGKLQEYITESLVRCAWQELSGNSKRLKINPKPRTIKVPIKESYVENIKDDEIKNHIEKNLSNYFFPVQVDKHIYIDNKFVMAIECKAYTENAMLKRILFDFELLLTKYPNLICYLFQLES